MARHYTRIILGSGSEFLLDRYDDGTASLSLRQHRSDTWSPPFTVLAVEEGTDPEEAEVAS